MALGTTNLYLRGDGSNNGLYKEMGKSFTQNNVKLGQAKYGVNDIDIANYAQSNPSMVKMSYWQSYDHQTMTFRHNPAQTGDFDTYDANTADYFGVDGSGLAFNTNAVPAAIPNTWEFPPGPNATGEWGIVNANTGYKQGSASTNITMCGWIKPGNPPPGQTTIIGTEIQGPGTVPAFLGYRMDINPSANKLRVIKGDGGGTGSGNRRTFESTGVLEDFEWNFVAFIGNNNNTTIGSTNNFFYTWSPNFGWVAGARFVSGTGGAVSYTGLNPMLIASGANNNRYWEGEFAAFWVFGDDISSADLQDLRDNTRGYLGV